MDRPAAGVQQPDHIAAAAGLDQHSPGEEVSRVEAADVVQAQETLVVDVLDVKPDLIDVAGEQHPFGPGLPRFFRGDQVTHGIGADLVEKPLSLASDHLAHALLTAGHSWGFGKRLEKR